MMMTTPAQGDGPSNRDGKEIAMLYLQINGTIALPSKEIQADAPNGCSVFVAIVLDTQTNAAQMNSEDCFKKYCRVGRSSGCTAQESIVLARDSEY